jgi:ATP-dependent DNA ligase
MLRNAVDRRTCQARDPKLPCCQRGARYTQNPWRLEPDSSNPLIASVKAQGLEGLVAKRRSSVYEPGQRSGSWQKIRVNMGQEFVIGGYTPSDRNFDALIIGYYEKGKLLYAGRTRNGFTPVLRMELMKRLRPFRAESSPFANLPEKRSGRWGQGLTAAKMKDCRWLRPAPVGQFEFVEWTVDLHLRHTLCLAKTSAQRSCNIVTGAWRSYLKDQTGVFGRDNR